MIYTPPNVISHIKASAGICLPFVRIMMGDDYAGTSRVQTKQIKEYSV